MRAFIALAVPLAFAGAYASPALAQDAPEPKVNALIVYGDDKCPESTDDTITVCARKSESERYRIPENLREHASPQNEAWNNKVLAYETVTKTGTQSCSAVGAGGWTGCSGKLINDAYAEKKLDPNVKFAEQVAAERAKRLSTIDADAAETQARVEALEQQTEERQKAEAAKADKDPNDTAAPAPPK
ncbi:MAG: hypothetical protein ACKOOL_10115 [Novosphingobium sp.]